MKFFDGIHVTISISMDHCRCSTIGAIVMTPLLTKLLAGQLVPVDAAVSLHMLKHVLGGQLVLKFNSNAAGIPRQVEIDKLGKHYTIYLIFRLSMVSSLCWLPIRKKKHCR